MKVVRIKCLSPLEESNPENDNLDVHVTLSDGRTYSFIVATPNNIYWCMENVGLDYFFGIPPVFVKRLTRLNIEIGLKALIADGEGKWLEVYGALQNTIDGE